ncbi:hypothetical protein [Burkholderia sp. Ac-20344]|uniref:hypothetical protein n=1 Tax=Burkholderia sp. Ac-20344 TaxID=2703890 RepID=UPI001F11ADC9|nr:hypothetical protein [Burkholderia sp. Ac-20344]
MLVSVSNPPLRRTERHKFDGASGSSYRSFDTPVCLHTYTVQYQRFWHTSTSDRQDHFAGQFTGQRFLFIEPSRVLGVHRSGYSVCQRQSGCACKHEDDRLPGQIEHQWLTRGGVYGYRKITADLRESGETFGGMATTSCRRQGTMGDCPQCRPGCRHPAPCEVGKEKPAKPNAVAGL